MKALNAHTLPLQGRQVIEASAGTGKTWTLAALYLRLVLGHERTEALLPPQILVMTFTDAATAELRERIRTRLSQAATYFDLSAQGRDFPASLKVDEFLETLRSSFDDALLTVQLRDPSAILPTMQGQNVQLKARFNGPFSQASFDYLLTAPRVAFDATGLEDVRLSGQGRLSKAPVKVPVRFTARRITGVGDVAGGILANISVDGVVLATRSTLIGENLLLKSDKLSGRLALFVDLKTGRYDVGLAGQLNRYFIPGIGLVDIRSELAVVPGPNGRGTRILGRGEAWVRRFDNAFFAGLAGGLPKLETALERTPDGVLRFTNMRLIAPKLRLTLSGIRRRDGSFQLSGSGSRSGSWAWG